MDALRRISPGVVALIGFPVASYFLIRPRNSQWLRFALSTAGSATMIHLGCKDIMPGYFAGVLRASICWMTSIRLVDVMTRPDPERKNMTFTEFAGKFAWFFLPISKNPSPRAPGSRPFISLITSVSEQPSLLRPTSLAGGYCARCSSLAAAKSFGSTTGRASSLPPCSACSCSPHL